MSSEIIASVTALPIIYFNVKFSKTLKENLLHKINGKTELNSLDLDMLVRGLMFFSLFAIEFSVLAYFL
jgi:hypothetical protein